MIRVAIADDQAMVRAGFAALLDADPGLDVVAQVADGDEAVELVERERVDVLLMDVRMPRMDGIEATRRIAALNGRTRVLMLTTFDIDDYVYEAIRVGASGFLLKDALPGELLAAVHTIARGDALLAPAVTRRMIQHFQAVAGPPSAVPVLDALTPRELEVLRLLARGRSNQEIAADLVVAEQTVKSHVSRILTKLALRDRAQAVIAAYESGLVTARPS